MSRKDASPPSPESVGAAAYPFAAPVLRAKGGLVFTNPRRGTVEAALGRVMQRVGIIDPERFAATLAESGPVFDEVMALVTVGETYFFREPAQFAFLRNRVLPEFRENASRRVRIWSAACATGEEAYSLAITASEAQVPWSVLGTDISRARLGAARRGRYREWSMRGVDRTVIDQYFARVEKEYAVSGELRRELRFTYSNLASDDYPTPEIHDFDVIFCRNVLIYFDEETIARVATRLIASLSHDGWLIVGASDPPLRDLVDCMSVQTDGGVMYRRRSAATSEPTLIASASRVPPIAAPTSVLAVPASAPVLFPSPESRPETETQAEPVPSARRSNDAAYDEQTLNALDLLRASWTRKDYAQAVEIGQTLIDRGDDRVEVMLLTIHALANSGRLRDAERVCAIALDRHGDVGELRSLMATLLLTSGHPRAAATEARRAIYLDRSLDDPYLVLADALVRLGDTGAARRALIRAERMMGSGQLKAVARARLRQLPQDST